MVAKLPIELVRELEAGDGQPLAVVNPLTKRMYVLVDAQEFDVVRRGSKPDADRGTWTEQKNERRCDLIRKKFAQGIDFAEADELSRLQDELSAFREQTVPLPYDVVDALQGALDSIPAA